jgi:hypothetical protein
LRSELEFHHQIFEPWPEVNGARVTEIFQDDQKGQLSQLAFSLGSKERPENFCKLMKKNAYKTKDM